LTLRLLLFGVLVLGAVCGVYGHWASEFDIEAVKEMPQRSTVYDVDGKVYSRLQGENRLVVPLPKVSRYFLDALLAREDSRFYWHRGMDPIGIARAVVRNVLRGASAQGASTLTQQLARNSFPEKVGQKKSLHRKLLEAALAFRIEQRYSKDEILEYYVNRIYFGSGVYGIEAASLVYFNKRAEDLALGEAAMISGIIRSPGRFSPFTNLKGAQRERDTVLERMSKAGFISRAEAQSVRETPLVVAKKRSLSPQENYVMDAVRRELDLLLSDDQRDDGGLKIYTTIDPVLQQASEKALDSQLRKIEAKPGYPHAKRADFSEQAREEEQQTPYLQGALMVVDNRSGGIRALVGGRDFAESKYNRAILPQAARQVGSTFKPFVYAAAFSRGLLPGAMINDGPIEPGELRSAPQWAPGNSDGQYKGLLRAEEGLIQSRNTMSVRVGERAGLQAVERVATAVGIERLPGQPAEYLGAFEGTVAELTSAYTVLANQGVRRQSYIIERIEDAAGDILYRAARVSRSVLDPGVSWMVTSVLAKAMERGTGAAIRSLGFSRPVAGKTGTTNDFRDAWFVGYTTSLTCGVWVGLDRPQTIIPKGYGAALALPVWADVMNAAPPTRYPVNAFRPPASLRKWMVCAQTNQLATAACEKAGSAYAVELAAGSQPQESCRLHKGESLGEPPRKPPEGILRSFRQFFGGN
jgi:penicillin-binding protein 1A